MYPDLLRFRLTKLHLELLDPFAPSAPFLCHLKTSENCKVFWCFQGLEKGRIGNELFKLVDVFKSNGYPENLKESWKKKNWKKVS